MRCTRTAPQRRPVSDPPTASWRLTDSRSPPSHSCATSGCGITMVRPSASSPVFLTATFRQSPSESPGGLLGRKLSNWFPAPFVLVGLAVLFLRLEDPNAWLLVLVFGGLIVTRDLPPTSPHPAWWPFAMAYQALLLGMLGPLFYWFFAVFPARSPIDRRLPWLKWSSLAIAFA